jgi:cytochrome b subunit of formate dehydrogenase/nitrate/TMAO reductase-like tetraheme cytochrome c subunit
MYRVRDLRFIVPILSLAAFLLTLADPVPAAAQDAAPAAAQDASSAAEVPKIPNSKCLNCHDDAELTNDAGESMAVHEDAFKAGAHKRVDCVECHIAAGTVKHPRNALGPVSFDVCMDCHEDEITPFQGSVHAKVKGGEPKACEGCHGNIHTTVRSNDPNAPMSPLNQVRNCGVCHEDMMEGYLSSVHAKSLFVSGLIEAAPSCADCHGTHDILRHTDPKARSSHARSPEMCGDCHQGILKEWDESAHGALWREGKDGPVCSTCHQAHAIESTESAAMRLHVPSDCGDCHADLYKSFHDSFHGKASAVGHGSAAMCSDCHTPHHNLPASDPRSSTHPDNLAATCGASGCHAGDVNASFLTFISHSDPMDKDQNAWVHYIYLFMTLLLLGVFGFFGLHALLWLQRTLVGRLRGEFKVQHFGPGPYVRRFTTTQMWLHVSIILSFLLLAVTGLPLKFAAAPWAPGLMAALGGAEIAGFLHRVAAVVTFGYFAVHLTMLFRDVAIRKEKGYFWGWRSMTPNLKDLQDLIANVKYFLYLGPRPALDRWAYWEKFDYLAVFWGVAMIGVSGLILWFPGFFTQFLPGWALNAAYIIHSDEALLATGFIFLFHFFHTHLRPESFPMDPVIFTGSQTLERFKHERPVEYQRLVDNGTLEQYFVPPPSKAQIQVAHVFGFAAVAAGIWMAVLIFRAIASGALHLF